jgi:hypothetical protein
MMTVMLAVEDWMSTNPLESLWRIALATKILERVVFMKLSQLEGSGITPLRVTILSVEFLGMIEVLWDLISILVSWSCSEGSKLGLPCAQISVADWRWP